MFLETLILSESISVILVSGINNAPPKLDSNERISLTLNLAMSTELILVI